MRINPCTAFFLCLTFVLCVLAIMHTREALFVPGNPPILQQVSSENAIKSAWQGARQWGLNMISGYSSGDNNSEDAVFTIKEVLKGPIAQDDPRLLSYIKSHYLKPPSDKPYNLAHPEVDDTSMGQSDKIREILGDMRNGFFVECGALDGETRSNTLVFERKFGWQGLLIEGDPKNFNLVTSKNRHVWTSNACLSPKPYPEKVLFRQAFNLGKVSEISVDHQKHRGFAEVQCLPFYSMLLALDRKEVDYFSLDVEGHELDVLRTIPFDKILIKTMSVEYVHDVEGKQAVRDFLEANGFIVYAEVTNKQGLANDLIVMHKSLKEASNGDDSSN